MEGLYNTILRRPADPLGLAAYTNQLAQGASIAQIKAEFYGSQEYLLTQTDETDQGFLTSLYRDELGRAVDPSSMQTYLQALANGTSRYQVALDVTTSLEDDTRVVTGYYEQILNRSPDIAGLNFWVGQLAQGSRELQVLAGFFGSPEFYSDL